MIFPPWWCWLVALYLGTGIYIAMAQLEVVMEELDGEPIRVRDGFYLGGMALLTAVAWVPQFGLYAAQDRWHRARH